jgi:hypothetical protein
MLIRQPLLHLSHSTSPGQRILIDISPRKIGGAGHDDVCNLSTREAEARGCEFKAHPGKGSETSSQKQNR